MNNEFVQYEQALALKELGFDEECIAFYKENSYLKAVDQHWGMSICGISKKQGYEVDDLIPAPTYSRVFRWIRENYDINVFCSFETIDDSTTAWIWNIISYNEEGKGRKKDTWDFYDRLDSFSEMSWFEDYDKAIQAGLIKVLKLISTKKIKTEIN